MFGLNCTVCYNKGSFTLTLMQISGQTSSEGDSYRIAPWGNVAVTHLISLRNWYQLIGEVFCIKKLSAKCFTDSWNVITAS